MEKKLFYKLPKDILVDLLTKTFDFEKLSVEQVHELHTQIQDKTLDKYKKELDKSRNILESKHNISSIYISTGPLHLSYIKVGNLEINVRDNTYKHKFSVMPHNKDIKTEAELIQFVCLYFKDNGILEDDIFRIIEKIREYIKEFEKSDILSSMYYTYCSTQYKSEKYKERLKLMKQKEEKK